MRSCGKQCLFLLFSACVFGLAGCGRPQPDNSASQSATEAARAAEQPPQAKTEITAGNSGETADVTKPFSDEELTRLVGAIESAVAHFSEKELDALLSPESLTRTTLAGLALSAEDRAGFQEAVADSFRNVFHTVLAGCREGGDYRFVRIINRNDQKTLLFRLTLPEAEGLNYHEMILARGNGEAPQIADLLVWKTGQRLSGTFRMANLESLVEAAGETARLSEQDQLCVQQMSKLREMRELTAAGKFRETEEIYNAFPDEFQKQKVSLDLRLNAAEGSGGETLRQAIGALRSSLPDDTSLPFRSLAFHASVGEWTQMVSAADAIQQATGDPYAAILKVQPLLEMKQTDSAMNAIRSVRAVAESDPNVYWLDLHLRMQQGDNAGTATLLQEMQTRFGLEFNRLEQIPEYAGFLQSAEGKAWLEAQAEASAAANSSGDAGNPPKP